MKITGISVYKTGLPYVGGRMFGVRETPFQQQWQLSW